MEQDRQREIWREKKRRQREKRRLMIAASINAVAPVPAVPAPALPSGAPVPVPAAPALPSGAPVPVPAAPALPSGAPVPVPAAPALPSGAPVPVPAAPALPSGAPVPVPVGAPVPAAPAEVETAKFYWFHYPKNKIDLTKKQVIDFFRKNLHDCGKAKKALENAWASALWNSVDKETGIIGAFRPKMSAFLLEKRYLEFSQVAPEKQWIEYRERGVKLAPELRRIGLTPPENFLDCLAWRYILSEYDFYRKNRKKIMYDDRADVIQSQQARNLMIKALSICDFGAFWAGYSLYLCIYNNLRAQMLYGRVESVKIPDIKEVLGEEKLTEKQKENYEKIRKKYNIKL